jgi:histidinol-phosphatase (PHP family)
MLTNLHTHCTLCDGKSTAEEVVLSAIEKGFTSLGFSSHGFTDFDQRFCLQDYDSYIRTLSALREKYKKDITIYIGVEEEAGCPVPRERFDYIIGSMHYFLANGRFYSIDGGVDCFKECIDLFDGDPCKMAQCYYETLCGYLLDRKPDIIGHFDLVTKFDELEPMLLNNPKYRAIAAKYIDIAANADCIFEVNTGAIARGVRTGVYPDTELLHILKKRDAKLTISSDSHRADTLDCYFEETRQLMRHIGFTHIWVFDSGSFVKAEI